MKIILLGSNGMLGNYIKTFLERENFNILSITRKDVDFNICDESVILQYFEIITEENDIIINAAGVIKQRDINTENMIKVNSLLPHILAKVKSKKNCQVIHITTDCVFSGKDGFYTEDSLHDATDEYGKSKSLGESALNTNIRTSIIGEEILNKKSLLEWVKSQNNKQINGYDNHYWNGVTCLELAKQIKNIIENKIFWTGTKHFFSPEDISKYNLILLIKKIYKLNISVIKQPSAINCFRNLRTIYNNPVTTSIEEQIVEQKNYFLADQLVSEKTINSAIE